jgi:GNAT superfamily N-acetyltransferase
MIMPELIFVKAETDDIQHIIQVVNTAYRGETSKLGWTTEADLLDGLRTDEKELLQLLADETSFILLCKLQGKVLGSVHLQYMGDCVEIGMFAVNPLHQGLGIGKQLLQQAELIAVETWPIQRLQMAVISCRYELLAFYHRRGYQFNGGTKAFPENPLLWTPKVKNLKFTLLEKRL